MYSNLLLLTLCLSVNSFAQSVQSAGFGAELESAAEIQTARQAARDQRRAGLRIALQSSRPADTQTVKAYDTRSATYHLSAKELAEMRQQLRQQQAEGLQYRP